jgi:hypothetical protein
MTMGAISKLAPAKRGAGDRTKKKLLAGYPSMKPEQLQAAAVKAEDKARKQREKAKREADRIAYLLANPKT